MNSKEMIAAAMIKIEIDVPEEIVPYIDETEEEFEDEENRKVKKIQGK